jgi:hypothetical protein
LVVTWAKGQLEFAIHAYKFLTNCELRLLNDITSSLLEMSDRIKVFWDLKACREEFYLLGSESL